jgi:hypothetical protein
VRGNRQGARRAGPRVLALGAVAVLVGGCLFGKARGEYWTGVSTGTPSGECVPFHFELSVIESGRVVGDAVAETWTGAVLWTVRGQVADGRAVSLDMRTEDPRMRRQLIEWRGQLDLFKFDLTEMDAAGCPAARTVRLQRR